MVMEGMRTDAVLLLFVVLAGFIIAGFMGRQRGGAYYQLPKTFMGRIGIGAAIASNWMSAASFLGVAGAVYCYGYYGIAFVAGWTGGYVLLLILMAEQLRRFGKYTAPDFVEGRYESRAARVISALITITISLIYCAAQYKGIALVFSWMFGIDYRMAVIVGGISAISYLVISGALGIVRRQQLQCMVLLVTFVLPLIIFADHLGFSWYSPQVGYGGAVERLHELGGGEIFAPWASVTPYQWIALCFTLMVGTAGLPHVLSHFYVVPNVRDARWSVVWGLLFIGIIYLSAPAFAIYAKVSELSYGMNVVPENMNHLADMVAIQGMVWAGVPSWVQAVVAVGAISAAFYAVSGLLIIAAGAFSYDIYCRFYRPDASEEERMWVAKLSVLALGLSIVFIALQQDMLIVQITAIAFALAGNTLFPVFLLGIWWEGTNKQGAIAGMVTGIIVTFASPLFGGFIPGVSTLLPVTSSALIGVPLVMMVMIVVSRMTPPPSTEVRQFLRQKVHRIDG